MVLAAALALASCSGDSGPASYDGPRDAERAIVNLTTEMASGGRRALRVEADSGFFQAGSGEVKLVGIHASMFSPDGVASVTIEADSAVLDDEAQRLTAMGEVLVRNRQGLSVETTELLFDASTSRLTSDSSTTVEEGGRTESGPCFESDSQLSQWRFCNGRQ
jgi:LPS export ABC transporter protein LptC